MWLIHSSPVSSEDNEPAQYHTNRKRKENKKKENITKPADMEERKRKENGADALYLNRFCRDWRHRAQDSSDHYTFATSSKTSCAASGISEKKAIKVHPKPIF